jgi:hypothetical protein
MGNKPHRVKKLQMKALRQFSQIDISKKSDKEAVKIDSSCKFLKSFNKANAIVMLRDWKKTVEHVHLKNKPHHSKRSTPGSVDEQNPEVISNYKNKSKAIKIFHKGDIVKSNDLGRKYLKSNFKKAA